MSGQANNNQDKVLNLDLMDYWMIIQKRAFDIFLIFTLVVLLTIWFTSRQTPVYQAESKIKIAARQPMATIEGAQITWYGGGAATSIQSEMELIANKDFIAETVADIIKRKRNSEKLKEIEKYLEQDELEYISNLRFEHIDSELISSITPASLKSALRTENISSSDIVVIRIAHSEPEIAEALANLYAFVYKADFWRSKTKDAEETKKFIEEQLNEIKTELENKKNVLQKSSEENIFLGAEEVYKQELSKLKIEYKKLSEIYQPDHPRLEKLSNLISAIEQELEKIPRVRHEYDDNLSDWELKQSLRKSLGEYFLKAEIDYKSKKEKTKDEIQIISKAAPKSAIMIRPQKTVNYIAGVIFGIIIALIYAFVWEGLDTSIGKIEDVERVTGLPVIAHIPVIGPSAAIQSPFLKTPHTILKLFRKLFSSDESERPVNIYNNVIFNFAPLSIEAEAFRTLRTNIQFAIGAHKQTGYVISITSTSPKEGKTLIATNLAIALAQVGKKTLLIEADMRRPKLVEIFKMQKREGLSDLLIGAVSKEEVLCTSSDLLLGGVDWEKLTNTSGIDNLNFIPAGTVPPNPGELLISREFSQLIEDFRQEYDFVIIDTPPTLPVSDSSIVGTVCDGTVLIYQSDKTSRHLLLRAIQILSKSKIKILGVVINQLAFDVVIRSSHYGYEYYSKNTNTGSLKKAANS